MTNFIGKTMIHNSDIMAEGRHEFPFLENRRARRQHAKAALFHLIY